MTCADRGGVRLEGWETGTRSLLRMEPATERVVSRWCILLMWDETGVSDRRATVFAIMMRHMPAQGGNYDDACERGGRGGRLIRRGGGPARSGGSRLRPLLLRDSAAKIGGRMPADDDPCCCLQEMGAATTWVCTFLESIAGSESFRPG